MIFQIAFDQISSEKIPKNTLLSFKRQKRTQLLKKENTEAYHEMTQIACKRRFSHVIAFEEFFEMPQNRKILFSVPFLFCF